MGKKQVDKRQKKLIKEENNRKRNGTWVGFRPSSIPKKTEYSRKGRVKAEVYKEIQDER